MTKSDFMKNAHMMARNLNKKVGCYSIALRFAMKQLWADLNGIKAVISQEVIKSGKPTKTENGFKVLVTLEIENLFRSVSTAGESFEKLEIRADKNMKVLKTELVNQWSNKVEFFVFVEDKKIVYA